MSKKLLQEHIRQKLHEIPDPELHVSIVDLGLIYNIDYQEKNKKVIVTMTLTSIGCPLFPVIEQQVQSKVREIAELKDVEVAVVLTFDPPWSMDRLSEKTKVQLGLV